MTRTDDYFSEDESGIAYRERSAPLTGFGISLFSLLFTVLPIAAVYDLWAWPWNGGKVMGLLTAAAFLAFGIASGLLAFVCIRPQSLRFDAASRRLQGRARGRFWLPRSLDVSFQSLQAPVVNRIERDEDVDLFEVVIVEPGQPPIKLGGYKERADADHWKARLHRLMNS